MPTTATITPISVPATINTQPIVFQMAPQHQPMNVKVTRALGIANIVVGSITLLISVIASVSLHSYGRLSRIGGGWCNAFVVVTGIFGVLSAARPLNVCLNGMNMAFNIIICATASCNGIVYAIILTHSGCHHRHRPPHPRDYFEYNHYNHNATNTMPMMKREPPCYASTTQGIFTTLLIFMLVEMFLSFVASIYSCKSCACCSCCNDVPKNMVMNTEAHYHVANATGQQMMMVPAPSTISTTEPPQYYYQTQQAMPTQLVMPPQNAGNEVPQTIRLHSDVRDDTYIDYPEKVIPQCYND